MQELPKKLKEKLSIRRAEDAMRKLPLPSSIVDFSSNDYLGLSKSNDVRKRTERMLQDHKIVANGATGSRLLSGNHKHYINLEKHLSSFHKTDAALVFNSGYAANLGFFSSVPQRGDIVFYDEFIHASIREGLKLGDAKSYKFKHNDLDDLRLKCNKIIQKNSASAVIYIVTEAVFSMDGDSPNLVAFANFAAKNNCRFVVDEAHAIGVFGAYGNGLVQQLEIEQKVFARIVTFGKALGCHGAAILGSEGLITYLINFAKSLIYTTALSPHAVATISAAYDFISSSKGLAHKMALQENIQRFNEALVTNGLKNSFIPSHSAIHCCILPGNEKVRLIAHQIQQSGFDVRPILSPSVSKGKERLRFCLHSYNTIAEIEEVLRLLATFTR